jgi:hypothetical protein
MKRQKFTGLLFILGALGVFVPYTVLTITFNYPDVLRQDAGEVLTKFYQGGNGLIITWWLFAILGLPLLIAYIQLGKRIVSITNSSNWLTSIGVIGLIVQMVGLLRWTFVVPILSKNFVFGDALGKEVSKALFQVVHQYGGVVLGEHLGQLFTILWVVGTTKTLNDLRITPLWFTSLGYASSFIYLLAQGELFATVIPTFPVWDLAGFIGSTLWLIWITALGIILLIQKQAYDLSNK